MRAHARNLRGLKQRILSTLPSDYNVEMLAYEAGVIAEALEHAAKEELEAGKRWWKEQEAKRERRIKAEMEEVNRSITPPRQEPWL